ncbi:MAG TPA: hypothetical protein VM934_04665 [Pyrinomonadaceae bacterium]|nr:hypothetical protein [Pyrinomonadaceae bacterium]
MSKKGRFHKHYGRDDKKRSPAELAASLAPVEEQKGTEAAASAVEKSSSNGGGGSDDTIIVDSKSMRLSGDFSGEGDDDGAGLLRFDPAVLVITLLALGFIAFIAYLISRMPAPAR